SWRGRSRPSTMSCYSSNSARSGRKKSKDDLRNGLGLRFRVVPGFCELARGCAAPLEDAVVLEPGPAQGEAKGSPRNRQIMHLHGRFALDFLDDVTSLLGVRLRPGLEDEICKPRGGL